MYKGEVYGGGLRCQLMGVLDRDTLRMSRKILRIKAGFFSKQYVEVQIGEHHGVL